MSFHRHFAFASRTIDPGGVAAVRLERLFALIDDNLTTTRSSVAPSLSPQNSAANHPATTFSSNLASRPRGKPIKPASARKCRRLPWHAKILLQEGEHRLVRACCPGKSETRWNSQWVPAWSICLFRWRPKFVSWMLPSFSLAWLFMAKTGGSSFVRCVIGGTFRLGDN